KKVPITLIREEGHVAIIKALDVSNMNRLEMRAIDQQWRSLQQQPQEAIPAFARPRKATVDALMRDTLAPLSTRPVSGQELTKRVVALTHVACESLEMTALAVSISIKFGDGQLLSSSTLITLRCSFDGTQLCDLPLRFLVVPGCQPSCILGRNLFSDLGIRMVSDHGIPITGLSTVSPSSAEGEPSPIADNAGHCACSIAVKNSYPRQCTPLINVVSDPNSSEKKILKVHFEALEHAAVEPFREAPRGRAPADNAIIFL
ncbi:hypothetical protein FOL46_003476, partial [Perkinsus olseni]